MCNFKIALPSLLRASMGERRSQSYITGNPPAPPAPTEELRLAFREWFRLAVWQMDGRTCGAVRGSRTARPDRPIDERRWP